MKVYVLRVVVRFPAYGDRPVWWLFDALDFQCGNPGESLSRCVRRWENHFGVSVSELSRSAGVVPAGGARKLIQRVRRGEGFGCPT